MASIAAPVARSSGQLNSCAASRMVIGAGACSCPGCPSAKNEVGVALLPPSLPVSASVGSKAAVAASVGAPEEDLAIRRFEEWEEWDQSSPFWRHALAGSCAGVMEHIGMFPLDTVKTHMQALRPGGPVGLSVVLREIAQESPMGFMRGASAIASGCIPAHVALFTSYEFSKRHLLVGHEHEPLRAAACGAISTFSHDLILTPMDVVKQRMQLGCYTRLGDCLRHIWQKEGMGALYRSMPTTLAMNVPFGSVLVAVNESLKLHMGLGSETSRKASLPWYFLTAGMSGAIASAATQPLDVIKTRLQTQDVLLNESAQLRHEAGAAASSSATASAAGREGLGVADARTSAAREMTAEQVSARAAASKMEGYRPKYSSFRSCLFTIIEEEGAWALYRGLLPRMCHAIPAAALCWGTYEAVKTALGV